MKKFLKTPQSFFISLSIITLIIGFIKKGSLIDLNYLANYLLIDVWSLCVISVILFILVSVNYASISFVGKKPRKILTIIHIALQLISIIPYYYIILTVDINTDSGDGITKNIILLLSFVVFILSLVIHLINFFASIFKQE